METKVLSRQQYLIFAGLLEFSRKQHRLLDDLQTEALKTIGLDPDTDWGHISDAMYSQDRPEEVLMRLGFVIQEESPDE